MKIKEDEVNTNEAIKHPAKSPRPLQRTGMVWTTTATGRKWNLLNPQPDIPAVVALDLALGLSNQTRFNGAVGHYSIAEHSVHVHDAAVRAGEKDNAQFVALMHDAHEAFIGDIVTPVMSALDTLAYEQDGAFHGNVASPGELMQVLKTRSDMAIFGVFGLAYGTIPGEVWQRVKALDTRALMTERDALAPNQPDTWGGYESVKRLPFAPECWSAPRAAREFLLRLAVHHAAGRQGLNMLELAEAQHAADVAVMQ
jgi:hypothetical protein